MRIIFPFIWFLLFHCKVSVMAQEPLTASSITLEQLQRAAVIGSLGHPLGKVVEIEATIIDGDETFQKQYSGRYLLRVEKVGGKPLKEPSLLTFGAALGSNFKLPSDGFELYERKYGRRPMGLSTDAKRELQRGFVNSTVRLLAYETGSFHGIPNGLPKGYPVWADVGFGFSTYLLLVQELPLQQ